MYHLETVSLITWYQITQVSQKLLAEVLQQKKAVAQW